MDAEREVMDVFLQPGEYFAGDEGYRVRTLLGSCVSITLWHRLSRVGAMSHFLLATRGAPCHGTLDGRYGDEALELMFAELRALRVEPRECEAKIFGGGDMFPGHSHAQAIEVGRRNGHQARALLAYAGIPVVSKSLFGVGHRQVIFDIASGDVWSRQVKPVAINVGGVEAKL